APSGVKVGFSSVGGMPTALLPAGRETTLHTYGSVWATPQAVSSSEPCAFRVTGWPGGVLAGVAVGAAFGVAPPQLRTVMATVCGLLDRPVLSVTTSCAA